MLQPHQPRINWYRITQSDLLRQAVSMYPAQVLPCKAMDSPDPYPLHTARTLCKVSWFLAMRSPDGNHAQVHSV